MRIEMPAAVSVIALISCLALADTVILNDGRRIEGTVTERGDMVLVQDQTGRMHSINRSLVKSIARSPYHTRADAKSPAARRSASVPAWQARIEAKLHERMSVDFNNTPIRDVVAFLRAQTGINFVLSPDVPDDTTITLSVKDMTLRNILQWIADNANLAFAPRNHALLIAPFAVVAAHQTMDLIDTRDLTLSLIDRPRRPNLIGESPQIGGVNAAFGSPSASGGGILRDARGRDLADINLQTRGAEITKMLVHTTGADNWAASPAYIIPHLPKDSD